MSNDNKERRRKSNDDRDLQCVMQNCVIHALTEVYLAAARKCRLVCGE